MSEIKFNDEPNIDMPAGAAVDRSDDARAQLEAAAREAIEKLAADMKRDKIHFIQFVEGGKFIYVELNLCPLLISFARAHGEAQYRAGLEAALAKAQHNQNHSREYYFSPGLNDRQNGYVEGRIDAAGNIVDEIRVLIEAAQDGKAGE